MDHIESACCFDSSAYTGSPDTAPTKKAFDVPAVIARLDGLYNGGREKEAEGFLCEHRDAARACGDWRAELSMISELMGHYRRDKNEQAGLNAVWQGLDIIKEHRMGSTVSGATVMLNAATTLKCFGKPEESVKIFSHVARVYADNLDPKDYRFAGLYNNMALSYCDVGDYQQAEMYFKMAIRIMEGCNEPGNEMAVTFCNMAEMYDKMDQGNPRVGRYMEYAWEILNSPELTRDGYHAFTVSKCWPTFEHFGFFVWAEELKQRAEDIYAGNR